MNKRFLFLATMVAMLVGFSACNQENPKDKNKDKDGENTELTPEQTKEKLMTIASSITDKFNTNDQKAAIQEFDDLYGKYQNYSFDDFEDHYAHRYDELFRLPQRAKAVMQPSLLAHHRQYHAGSSAADSNRCRPGLRMSLEKKCISNYR